MARYSPQSRKGNSMKEFDIMDHHYLRYEGGRIPVGKRKFFIIEGEEIWMYEAKKLTREEFFKIRLKLKE